MEISKNSWHTKYYQWLMVDYGCLPDSLCNYFWTVIIGLISFPLIIFCSIPIWIIWKIKNPKWSNGEKLPICNYYATETRFGLIGIGLLCWTCVAFIYVFSIMMV